MHPANGAEKVYLWGVHVHACVCTRVVAVCTLVGCTRVSVHAYTCMRMCTSACMCVVALCTHTGCVCVCVCVHVCVCAYMM